MEAWCADEELPMSHRELSISMLKESGQEIYRRYVCVTDWTTELRQRLTEQSPTPHKFDIGGIYDRPVSSREDVLEQSKWRCVKREFVLDIDMNDYDAIRTCCQGKVVCPKCWLFMAVAGDILGRALQQQLGWHELLYVFSGRRGLHIWCRDRTAKLVEPEVRGSLVTRLSIEVDALTSVRQADNILSQCYIKDTALPVMRAHWSRFLTEQEPFLCKAADGSPNPRALKNYDKLFYFIEHLAPSANVTRIQESLMLAKADSSVALWRKLSSMPELERALAICMLWLLAPRLDKGVSRDKKHLLKAPMVIHQGTGKLCCPIAPSKLYEFDPDRSTPTLTQLCDRDQGALAQFEAAVLLLLPSSSKKTAG